jgi:dTDP-4-dehydrorhamnose reductase
MKNPLYLVSDIIISPTYIPDLVNTTLDLLEDNESGIWHLSNQEEISFFHFAKKALDVAGISDKNINAISSAEFNYAAERPQYSVLSSSQGIFLPPLQHAIENYLTEFRK